MRDICTVKNMDNIYRFVSLVGWVIFFILIAYVFLQLKKVGQIEKEIDAKQGEIDGLTQKTLQKVRNSLVNQGQLEKMIAKEGEPFKKQLRDLKRKRQFILDKLPFFGMLKK